jgi:hypothetical protein
MSLRVSKLIAALLLGLAAAGTANAQNRLGSLHLGPRMSYQFDLEEFGVGAQFSVPIARSLEFYPSFDTFFVDEGSFWHLNADLKLHMSDPSAHWLYLGTGLNMTARNVNGRSRNRTGLNLFAGVEGQTGTVHPFAEVRFTLNDGSTGQLAFGLNFVMR